MLSENNRLLADKIAKLLFSVQELLAETNNTFVKPYLLAVEEELDEALDDIVLEEIE